MKKNILLHTFVALLGMFTITSQAGAQIILKQADIPAIGTTAKIATDSTTKLSPGSPSASSQTWDFSTLLTQDTARYIFVDPSTTKYASIFTSANLADSIIGTEGYTYFHTDSTVFSVVGSEQIVPYQSYKFHIEMNLNPPFVQSTLPATYNTKVSGTSSGSQKFNQVIIIYDSERIAAHIIYSDTVDAWGTMKTPTGTYSVLRQKHDEIDIDSVFGHNSFSKAWGYLSRTVSYAYQYNWYTKGVGYILVQMNMDSTSATVHNIKWDASAPTGINELSHSGKVTAYPNPCTTQITFRSSITGSQYLSVYDITGRKLETMSVNNGMVTLQTAAYAKGLYLYNVTDKSGRVVDEGKFSVQ